ncbi:IucA/IucC family protein [Kosakonia radicincitans]|uniref:IucA/IucC family protein n=1 Tax=Kosakonia radicincitans TaxID=283686 RepID=UPI0005C2C697|nr:IucA/IucC family protein [Kosakonia radicincitans]KIS42556.1 iucA / IucC family protein [Kosakonia radicincitans YD4]
MNQHDYITLRIINACLRENVSGLISRGQITQDSQHQWLTWQSASQTLRLQVNACDYMQPWRAVSPEWQIKTAQGWHSQSGYANWLAALMPDQQPETRELFATYKEEADSAVAQGELCALAFAQQRASLLRSPHEMNWGERLRHADQLASFLDHPYYPTARAKFGFSEADLRQYAPEFCQPFRLRWLALPQQQLTLTAPEARPHWWPLPSQVGLDPQHFTRYALIPVHPLTLSQLHDLPEGAVIAPDAWLDVYPTLSVRTVQLADYPDQHLKVPLSMRTLGQKNIRLIKPSTLYDGQWFAEVLTSLGEQDSLLRGKYRHVDERFCGHVAENKQLAFLLRRYAAPRTGETLLPVAALGSKLPDGRYYLSSLLEQPGMPDVAEWWRDYCQLMADVHLTLWLRYGIALESNQQNAVLSLTPNEALTLVMKDNDAARILPERFTAACPHLAERLITLRDPRICVSDEAALAQMFITITLQLCLAAVLESLTAGALIDREVGYQTLRHALEQSLARLESEGVDTAFARQQLFVSSTQPVKYLLLSGSLLSKQASGAADINKFYGQSGPNFLLREKR